MLPKFFCFKLMSNQNQKIKKAVGGYSHPVWPSYYTNKRAGVLRGFHISSFLMSYTHRHGKWEGSLGWKEDLCSWLKHALHWRGTELALGSPAITSGFYTKLTAHYSQELVGSKAKSIHSRKTVTSCLSHTLGMSPSCTGPEHRQTGKGDGQPCQAAPPCLVV